MVEEAIKTVTRRAALAGDARSDVVTEYVQPFELSGTGEITDGTVHLHVLLGGEGDIARTGHLHWAR